MKKQPVSWQLAPNTIKLVKKAAKKSKVAAQVKAEELILKALES